MLMYPQERTCHTEKEVADQTFHLTQSVYTDTGPTSPSADPTTPGAWQGSHWSATFQVTGMTRPGKIPTAQVGIEPGTFCSRGGEPSRSRPNCHCSRPNRHNNLRRPLISFGPAVGQTVSGYFALQDAPAHRPSQLSPVSVLTDMFIRLCPSLVCFLGLGVVDSDSHTFDCHTQTGSQKKTEEKRLTKRSLTPLRFFDTQK